MYGSRYGGRHWTILAYCTLRDGGCFSCNLGLLVRTKAYDVPNTYQNQTVSLCCYLHDFLWVFYYNLM